MTRAHPQPPAYRLAPLLALLLAAPALPARGEPDDDLSAPGPAPKVFVEFKEALAHAEPRQLHIFAACLRSGHAESGKLAALLESTNLYLNGEKVVLFLYRIDDDARGESFRSYFGVSEPGYPIVVVTNPAGRPLKSLVGLHSDNDYYGFVEEAAGYAALNLPSTLRLKRNIADVLKETASGKGKYHTPMRAWTLVTGEKFDGAVLHSAGQVVTFETKDGTLREVAALQLSRPDFEFIKKALESNQRFP